jgi:gliding motility-associated protein GldL
MNSIALFFETKQGKYLKNLIIGLGAAVVLLGALFKLQHWQGAGIMLTAGMMTEAFIFALLGLLPPHKDYYWERYYPNLDKNPHIEAYRSGSKEAKASSIASLDQMMQEANLNQPNIKRLSENFEKFNRTVEQIQDIAEVTAATNTYATAARETAGALGEMKETFIGAARTMSSFNSAADDTARFHEQVQVLSRNLGTLNHIYEVELQDANNHLKAMNKFYSNLVTASDAMASSASDAQAAKEQIGLLAKNLNNLNQIYGNMLSAMQMGR